MTNLYSADLTASGDGGDGFCIAKLTIKTSIDQTLNDEKPLATRPGSERCVDARNLTG